MAYSSNEYEVSIPISLKTLKEATRGYIQESQTEDGIPDSPELGYREVPVEVRQRSDRTIRAEPPPPPVTQNSSTLQRRRLGRGKKQTNGFDGDSGSDSDEGDPKDGRNGNDGPIARQRRQAEKLTEDSAPPAKASSSSSTFLTPEEEKRMRLHRALQKDSRIWQGLLDACVKHRSDGPSVRSALISYKLNPNIPPDSVESDLDVEVIRKQDERLRDYLDEALYHELDETASDSGSDSSAEQKILEEVIYQIESEFISSYLKIRPHKSDQACRDDLFSAITRLIKASGHLHFPSNSAEKFVSQHLRSDLLPRRYGLLVIDEIFREETRSNIQIDTTTTPTHSGQSGSSVAGAVEECRTDLSLMKSIVSSRQKGLLNPKYTNWIYTLAPRSEIKKYCRQRRRQMRGRKIRGLFEQLGQSSISQEFYVKDAYGGLGLVLFKGNLPYSLSSVNYQLFCSFGWFRPMNHERWVRYELDEYGEIFLVTMDKEVLALATPEGDMYFYDSDLQSC
ncbi:uncharacterized protein F4822DRAFT_364623 [Hypoxylon trugodes]|uniref:uncharacterized protein n=1 Tax=Hypoxylon trugodes TaxID=326681 RepID=UPI002193F357|nr:uncharacterized protein F4822DRAFT_364623 [Hypoxylon trugodes]KAI1384467.1 hypothetical protein F4822DRAFT_364623 [Hypoxylon trugodes]